MKLTVVVESAYGQLESMVRDRLYGLKVPVRSLLKPGVGVTAEEIVDSVIQFSKEV